MDLMRSFGVLAFVPLLRSTGDYARNSIFARNVVLAELDEKLVSQ
jgi:hypothetical protein